MPSLVFARGKLKIIEERFHEDKHRCAWDLSYYDTTFNTVLGLQATRT